MSINAFGKDNLAQFRQDFMAAVADVGNRHGILIELGTVRFTAAEAHGKLSLSVMKPTEAPTAADKFPPGFPLTDSDIGKTVKFSNGDYRIDGYNPAKRTRCVKLTRLSDGNSGFLSNVQNVLAALGRVTLADNDTYPGDREFNSDRENFDTYNKRTTAMLEAIPRDKMITFPIADGHALYYVESLRPLRLKHIPYGDAYRVLPATLRGLRTADVERMIVADRALAKMFAKR